MKKVLLILGLFCLSFSIYSQEIDETADFESEELILSEDSDSLDDFSEMEDEWAELFEEAEDVAAVTVKEEPSKVQLFLGSANIRLSGHFDGDVGVMVDFDEIERHIDGEEEGFFIPLSGGFLFGNYLYFTAAPSDTFQLKATLYTALSTSFTIKLDSIYCNYTPFDGLYISAGKKSVSWGYTRIFNDTDYYGSNPFTGPQLTNIMGDSGSYFVGEVKYPWSKGTLTGVFLCDYKSLTGTPGLAQIGYALSSEMSIPHFTFNLFGRYYGQKDCTNYVDVFETTRSAQKNPLAGIEGKLSFNGYDAYAQGVLRIKSPKNFEYDKELCGTDYSNPFCEYGVVTIGGYKLWDKQDPNFGLNIEYQYQCIPSYTSIDNQHRIAVQAGVKRMGPRKNLKLAADWYHNFTENFGQTSLSFIVANIFNYAQLTNSVKMQYGNDLDTPRFTVGTGIQVDVDY